MSDMTQRTLRAPPTPIDPHRLPDAIAAFLNGDDLAGKVGPAIRLSTVDADGWPHAALLSVGEVLLVPPRTLRLCLHDGSGTTANLRRDGRLTLAMPLAKGLCEIRLRVAARSQEGDASGLALFEGTVEVARHHTVPYADVVSGVTFALHDPAPHLERWTAQVARMRAPPPTRQAEGEDG